MRATDTPAFGLKVKPPLPPFVDTREMSGLGSTVSLQSVGDAASYDHH
jgi:hypothetical protein